MTDFIPEPLNITMGVQAGTYEVTLNITAHSDTTFFVTEINTGRVWDECEIAEDESRSLAFNVTAKNEINITIHTEGDMTATAFAEYIN